MGQLQQRIFAFSGAILFFVTSIALTVVVVITMIQDGNKKPADATAAADGCQATQAEAALPAPEVYKPDGTVTELAKTDLETGSGAAAKAGDCLVVKYYGTLAADGTLFDETYTKPTAFAFVLGQGSVIKGWDQGLVGLKVGGTRRLVIPPALAYGDQAQGDAIPANAALVFVVKLLRIQ